MAHRLRAPLIVFGVLVALARPAAADKAPAAAPPDDESTGAAQPTAKPPVDLGEELPTTRPADLAYGVAAQLRWVSVPSWLLNAFTKKNVPLSSWGTGVSVFRRKGNFDIAISFNYQNMSPPDGNWLGSSNDPTKDVSFLQFRSFALYGFDFSFLWHNYFTNWFGISYGAGVGIGILSGYIERTRNLTGCTAANAGDPSMCMPGANSVTAHLADVPPAVPIFNVQLGLDFRVPTIRGWEARIEGGFYDAFFLGGGVGYTF
ncbi:MAG TPA: hypothetical protein VH853_11665 [Polyangia bacterium]|jgi:hypothetical protein|nr:hypothetical protein [Polyangia bacterium]